MLFSYHKANATGLGFTADGKYFATGKEEKLVLFDGKNHEVVCEFTGHGDFVTNLAFSEDGMWLVSCSMDQSIRAWDIAAKAEIHKFSITEGIPTAVAVSPDRRYIVAATNMGEIYAWDTVSRQLLYNFSGHQDKVGGLVYSTAKDTFYSGSMDNSAKWWDTRSGTLLGSFTAHSAPIFGIALAKDSRVGLSGSADKCMRAWDPVTGKELLTPAGHTDNVNALAMSADGYHLLSGGDDQTLRLWEMGSGTEQNRWNTADAVSTAAFSPDNSKIAAAVSSRIMVWDRFTGKQVSELAGHKNRVRWLQFSPGGEFLYSSGWDGTILKWDIAKASLLDAIATGNSVECSAVLGNLIICGHWDGNITLWDPDSRKLLHSFKAHDQVVKDIACFEDGRQMLSTGDDRCLKIWDTASWRLVNSAPLGPCKKTAVFPGKAIALVALEGKEIEVWSLSDLQKLYTIAQPVQPLCILTSHDEKTFISGNAGGIIYLYEQK